MASNTISQQVNKPLFAEQDRNEWLRRIGLIMAIVGIGISAYLSYVKISDTEAVCAETGVIDCAGVQESAYASLLGIPIAYLGLLGYGAILVLLFFNHRIDLLEDYGHALLFSITFFGFMYSMFLSYVEAFVLHKWCLWCVASALLMTGLFALSSIRLYRFMQEMEEQDED